MASAKPLKRTTAGRTEQFASSDTVPVGNLPVFIASGGSNAAGIVPAPGGSSGTTKFLREDATWQVPAGGGSSPITDYTTTVANCSNTTTETTIISATVPANAWLDGEIVTLRFRVQHKNNSGAARNLTLKVYFKTTGFALINAVSMANSASTGNSFFEINLQRNGTNVDVLTVSGNTASTYFSGAQHPRYLVPLGDMATGTLDYGGGAIPFLTGETFNVDCAVAVKITLSAASTNLFFNAIYGKVRKGEYL